MFEKIVLRRGESGEAVSAGQIAEALLFYQNVHLLIDLGSLRGLLGSIGIGRLMTILRRPGVTATYSEEFEIVKTEPVGAFNLYTLEAASFVGHASAGGAIEGRAERLMFHIEQSGIQRADARKFAQRFVDVVPFRKLAGDHYIAGGLPAAARADLLNTQYLHDAIREMVAMLPGGYHVGTNLKFDVVDTPIGFHVFTDLDLQGINRRRAAAAPQVEPLTIAFLLAHVLTARVDLALAAYYGGDFITSNTASRIVRLRHADLLRRAELNRDGQEQFTELNLPDCPSLREVIDKGERSFDEFLVLLGQGVAIQRMAPVSECR